MKRSVAIGVLLALVVGGYMSFFMAKRLPMTDEGVAMVLSREIMEGRPPYLHIDTPYTPLAFMIQAEWMRMVGHGLLANRGTTLIMAILSAVVIFLSLRRPLGEGGAILSGLAVVVATYPYQCYVSYNNYSMFFGILSACAIFSMCDAGDRRRAFLAGFFAGASFLSKQNLGGLAIVAGVLALVMIPTSFANRFRAVGGYLAGILFTLAPLSLAAWATGYLRPMIEQAILGGVGQATHFAASYPVDQLFLLKHLLVSPSLGGLEAFSQSASYVLPFLVAMALLPFLVAAIRDENRDRVRLLGAAVVMAPLIALGAIHAPTTWHIIFVKPVPIMATALLLKEMTFHRAGRVLVLFAILFFFGLHLGRQIMIFDDYDAVISAPHAAEIRLRRWEAEIIDHALAAIQSVPALEPVFVAAPDPLYYHFTDRRPPLPWIYIDPPLATREFGEMLVRGIETTRSWTLVLSGRNPFFDYRRIPALQRHLEAIRPVSDTTINGVRIALYPPTGE